MSHNDFLSLRFQILKKRKRLLKLLVVLIILQAPTPKKIADELFEFV